LTPSNIVTGMQSLTTAARIAKYDLLSHPFYRAWNAGELSREDLREYVQDYYHHVQAFPTYLAELAIRLDEGELRRAVLANTADERGLEDGTRSQPACRQIRKQRRRLWRREKRRPRRGGTRWTESTRRRWQLRHKLRERAGRPMIQ